MENIIIRKAMIDDAEQVISLTSRVWRSAYAHIMPQEVFDKKDNEYAERVERFKTKDFNKKGSIALVAVDDDKIIAMCLATYPSEYEHYKALDYADLQAIHIDQEYQRLGIGKKLLDMVVAEFKEMGCDKTTIGVLKENQKARKAYQKWGGKLDTEYESFYKNEYPEVFYLFDL